MSAVAKLQSFGVSIRVDDDKLRLAGLDRLSKARAKDAIALAKAHKQAILAELSNNMRLDPAVQDDAEFVFDPIPAPAPIAIDPDEPFAISDEQASARDAYLELLTLERNGLAYPSKTPAGGSDHPSLVPPRTSMPRTSSSARCRS